MTLVVPLSQRPSSTPQWDPPDEPWALMAAAQMHSEGRLVQTAMNTEGFRRSDNIEDRRGFTAQREYSFSASEAERLKAEGDKDPDSMSSDIRKSDLAKGLGSDQVRTDAEKREDTLEEIRKNQADRASRSKQLDDEIEANLRRLNPQAGRSRKNK